MMCEMRPAAPSLYKDPCNHDFDEELANRA